MHALSFLRTFRHAGRSRSTSDSAPNVLVLSGMNTERIDFISSYCDRWCERCAFTARCPVYAVEVATAMCGDLREGMALAVGSPHPAGAEPTERRPWIDELVNVEVSAAEKAEYDRQERIRRTRLDAAQLSKRAWAYTMLSHRWLDHHSERLRASRDPVLVEALDVAAHDSALISAKLHRALDGRDRHTHDPEGDDDPLQNDWNGSAKVALLSLERSEIAWRAIAQPTSDPVVVLLADAARDLHRLTLEEFPRAMSFVRPGFDEPWR